MGRAAEDVTETNGGPKLIFNAVMLDSGKAVVADGATWLSVAHIPNAS